MPLEFHPATARNVSRLCNNPFLSQTAAQLQCNAVHVRPGPAYIEQAVFTDPGGLLRRAEHLVEFPPVTGRKLAFGRGYGGLALLLHALLAHEGRFSPVEIRLDAVSTGVGHPPGSAETEREIIGSDESNKLRFTWIWNEILRQHQCDDLAITKFRLSARFSFQKFAAFGLIPIINQYKNDRQKCQFMGILVMGMLLSDLDQYHNLEGIPSFRQPLFDFTLDIPV